MTTTVAVLGTGIMGAAMARNLLRAGLEVRVWNRTRERALPLGADGATVALHAADAVAGADVVLTMPFDGTAVREVMAEAGPAMREGAVWMQSTTVGVDEVPAMAALANDLGVTYVDAPVLGTRAPAEAGQLTVLAAGPLDARETLDPVLDAIASKTVWTGEDGAQAASTRLKLVANSWVLAVSNAAGEMVALAEALDVDPRQFLDLIEGGPLDSGYLRVKAGLIMDDALTPPSFSADAAGKDAALIVAAAQNRGVRLDGAQASADRFARAVEQGHGGEDMAAAYFASFEGN
ncbi:NAD(P)-dependent oxidoreductase [Demequina aurantiaca]|uniref:NAD(P)-dependent oxidoreductase n=1 Tax=Demequina aurantiaca TaxID=676200 RepID=UPI000780A9F7|nr:NAD(P)-dependent oxidoreductase [Demequina aurantiaca]